MSPWTPLAGATLGWGTGAVMTRALLVRGVNTWTLIPLRMVIALCTLIGLMAVSRRYWTTDARAWGRGLLLGTVAMAFPMVLMTLGLEDLPVSLGSLLVALIPIATIGAAHFLVEGERFQLRALPGLLLALGGSALLVGLGGDSATGVGDLWRGVGFTMAGVLLGGIGGALSRRFAMEIDSNDLVLPQFTVNTLFVVTVLPLVFEFDVASVQGSSWWLILGVGTLGTTVAFGSFLMAAGMNPASRLAMVGYAVPVLAVALAVMFLGETLTPAIAGGAALIIIGVVLTERATTAHVPEPGVATAR
jgi:drug/metabolite transporter (DMT)-like permease